MHLVVSPSERVRTALPVWTVTKHYSLAECLWQAENLFADMEYLKSQGHPARMAPGLLTASVADALIVGSGIIEGYAVAMIGIDNLIAKKGVYAGDTVTANFQVCSRVVSNGVLPRVVPDSSGSIRVLTAD